MEHLQTLISYWREEAKRHEDAAQDCDIGDDEYFLNRECARVYQICAKGLEKSLQPARASQTVGMRTLPE